MIKLIDNLKMYETAVTRLMSNKNGLKIYSIETK